MSELSPVRKCMEPASKNAESTQPLPLFRPEALAAREKLQGEALSIRAFSSSAFLVLVGGVIACALVFLLLGQYEPRATVTGSISSVTTAGSQKTPSSNATFYAPGQCIQNVHPGSRLAVYWPRSSQRASLPGVVVGIRPAESPVGAASSHLALPGPVYQVTVAIPLNSLPAAAKQLHLGAKLEADFPLARRPLLRWLIGAAAL
jgi:hypothetical protein